MGHIQEEMSRKRFDFADKKRDRIHDSKMKDMLKVSSNKDTVDKRGTLLVHQLAG
jgi:hypothetical protein